MNTRSTLRLSLAAALLAPALFAQSTNSTNTTSSQTSPSTAPAQAVTPPPVRPNPSATTPMTPAPVVPPVATPPTNPAGPPVSPLDSAPGSDIRPVNPDPSRQPNVPPGINATTRLDASGNPIGVSGTSIDALAAAGVEVALSPQETLEALRNSPATEQERLVNQLRTRVEATNRALTELRAQARSLGVTSANTNFDQAAADVRAREDVIRDTLRNASITATEEDWVRLRSLLATQYQTYADSVLRARDLLQVPPPQQ